jgi:hypothetical protein
MLMRQNHIQLQCSTVYAGHATRDRSHAANESDFIGPKPIRTDPIQFSDASRLLRLWRACCLNTVVEIDVLTNAGPNRNEF